MALFGVHVVLPHGCDYVQFAPGDEVPDWAVGLVGEHCLAEGSNVDEPVVPDESDDEAPAVASVEIVPDLDFTAPAKPVRGRPRKS